MSTLFLGFFLVPQTGCRAEPWSLWEQYSQHFIDAQGRVIDHASQDRTTSEGEAYAMFFAVVANDRPRFEKLLEWTQANLASGDLTLRLPAWNWGKNADGSWKVIDPNPAADADLWMSYSLMEAGRLWKEPKYEKLGSIMATRIAQQEVVAIPGLGNTLIPGPQGFHPDDKTWVVNPSYLPLPILLAFAKRMPQGPWLSVIDSLRILLARGSGSGYVMDWVAAGSSVHASLSPTQLATGKTEGLTPIGGYEAIRVYLWLGLADPATPVLKELLADTSGMSNYLKTSVTPPLQVDATGKILNPDGPVGFSAAVIPYLYALNLKAQEKAQADRLIATKDAASGLYGREGAYYDQNLALFATGWSEQRFRFDRDGRLKLNWK